MSQGQTLARAPAVRAVKNVPRGKAVMPGGWLGCVVRGACFGAMSVALVQAPAALSLRLAGVGASEVVWRTTCAPKSSASCLAHLPFLRRMAGAGAFEVALARHLRTETKRSISGRAKLGIEAFAEALLGFPKILAENSGHEAQECIIKLQVRQSP